MVNLPPPPPYSFCDFRAKRIITRAVSWLLLLTLVNTLCPVMVLAQKSRNNATLPGVTPPPPPPRPAPPTTTPPPAQPDPPDENLPPANNNAPPPLTAAASAKGNPAQVRNGGELALSCADCDNGNGYVPTQDPNFTDTRIAPRNDKGGSGVTLGSRNYNWGTNLVHLPGRAGMDLDISLSYNSLVWSREGSIIKFNADRGWPAPGFEMGWPTLESGYAPGVTPPPGQPSAYVVTWPSGGHTRLVWSSQDSICQKRYAVKQKYCNIIAI